MGPESSDDDERGSKLGRKDHWDETYAMELDNLQHNGDEGEIWFGEDVMETMVNWTVDLLQKEHPLLPLEAAILDVGTGNGVLPLELARHGFCNLTGSDYSEAAIQLARAVADKRGITSVGWVVDDLLHTFISDRFDVITDKGTYDAIGLSKDATANRQLYISAVKSLLKPRGLLVITSCNTTREELTEEFCGAEESREGCECDGKGEHESGPHQAHKYSGVSEELCGVKKCGEGSKRFGRGDVEAGSDQAQGKSGASAAGRGAMIGVFDYVDHVRTYPVFRFGGVEGSKVCTVAFRRT